MKVITNQRKLSPNSLATPLEKQRKGLLAMIHIAVKETGLTDAEYRAVLKGFGVGSSSCLSIPELERLVKYLKEYGWTPKPSRKPKSQNGGQAAKLRERILDMASRLDRGEKRLPALVKSLCGVERLEWCRDAVKLKRLLAALGKILDVEGLQQMKGGGA